MKKESNGVWSPKPIKFKFLSVDKTCILAVMKCVDWWSDAPFKPKFSLRFPVPCKYVVCQYSNYSDGVNDHFEGRITRAVCDGFEDAMILFDNITK